MFDPHKYLSNAYFETKRVLTKTNGRNAVQSQEKQTPSIFYYWAMNWFHTNPSCQTRLENIPTPSNKPKKELHATKPSRILNVAGARRARGWVWPVEWQKQNQVRWPNQPIQTDRHSHHPVAAGNNINTPFYHYVLSISLTPAGEMLWCAPTSRPVYNGQWSINQPPNEPNRFSSATYVRCISSTHSWRPLTDRHRHTFS